MATNVTINGLVIKVGDYAENDRILTVLTEDRGRLTVIAKGARSVRYKNLGAIRLFSYSAFVLYEKGGFYWLKEAALNTYFDSIFEDIESISLCSYLAELAYELTGENESGLEALRLLLNTFYAISERKKSHGLLKAAFELRIMAYSGYMPSLDECSRCERENSGYYYFDVMNGEVICDSCFNRNSAVPFSKNRIVDELDALGKRATYVPISYAVLNAIRYVTAAELKRLFAFRLDSDEELYSFGRLAEIYTLWHLGHGFETLDFYKKIVKDATLTL
ncbi:MAG: DNA repair protein RecO [Clostridia bacterium]|nr:DNA repair protein RecO [Clostridia bacterium]